MTLNYHKPCLKASKFRITGFTIAISFWQRFFLLLGVQLWFQIFWFMIYDALQNAVFLSILN